MNRCFKFLVAFLVLFFFPCLWLIESAYLASPLKSVYVIPVYGTVDPGMAAFIKRAFLPERTPGENVVYVLEIDTFGGRVDSALEIVDTILESPKGKTVAYVKNKAISAGALISLACSSLFMKPHTTIGDCAPITYDNDGPKLMGEKFQSPLRAKFRALARRNGYPETLAESMVTPEMEVYEVIMNGKTHYLDKQAFVDLTEAEKSNVTSRRTVVAEGELLTMDDIEAKRLGFSKMSVTDIEDILENLNIQDVEIVRVTETWSESLVRFLVVAAPVLMLIGLGALYTEIQSPGFGIPGIIGILCLAIVFFNQYLVGLADYTELLIIILGIGLLSIEVLVIPGFGVAGFAGVVCLIVGMILSLQDFVLPDPSLPWQTEILVRNIVKVLGSFLGAFFAGLLVFRYILPAYGGKTESAYLSHNLRECRANSNEIVKVREGDRGIALSFLRPSGKAEIKGEPFDVISEGEFIEKGTPVIVYTIKGNRLIVRAAKNEEKIPTIQ